MLEPTSLSFPKPADLIPGYRLEKVVGRGGMGEVHKATQLSLDRTVAVKLLAAELAGDESFVARFEKEAAALATLSHPNIVSIVDKGRSGAAYFLVMEFVDGPSLRELLQSPELDHLGALRIAVEVCRAIDYAHSRGVIHRDLKPENILFAQQAGGHCKVTDFGLAGFTPGSGEGQNLTKSFMAMGTASYMAPEQKVDARGADGRADIYSLGVILYELCTRELPVGQFDPPSKKNPLLPSKVDEIVARCLKPRPEDRYPNMAELLRDLEPLAPSAASLVPQNRSLLEQVRVKAARAGRLALRAVQVALMAAAVLVLAGALYRARFAVGTELPLSEAAAVNLPTAGKLHLAGRIEGSERRRLLLGKGPDQVAVLSFGRPLETSASGLSFGLPTEEARAGLARPDAVDFEGEALSLGGAVRVTPPESGTLAELGRFLRKREWAPRAGLMLLGENGRFVALGVGAPGTPVRLEWELGERRAVLMGGSSPVDVATLELSLQASGTLVASVGAGRDRRAIGEPIDLGPGWVKHFGGMPRPSFYCLDGSCALEQLEFQVTRPPPPAPAPAEPVQVVAPSPPPKAVAAKAVSAERPLRRKAVVAAEPTSKTKPAKRRPRSL